VRDARIRREAAQRVKPQRVHEVVQRDHGLQLIPARRGALIGQAVRRGERSVLAAKH
jgi:hypothetical protein